MPLNLELNTFGRTPACHILVEKLNRLGDEKLAASVSRVFNPYFTGLRDLIRVNQPTRQVSLKLWRDHALVKAHDALYDRFSEADIPYSYVENIIKQKYKQAHEHALIIDRLNYGDEENRDFKSILDLLVDIDRRREYDLIDSTQK